MLRVSGLRACTSEREREVCCEYQSSYVILHVLLVGRGQRACKHASSASASASASPLVMRCDTCRVRCGQRGCKHASTACTASDCLSRSPLRSPLYYPTHASCHEDTYGSMPSANQLSTRTNTALSYCILEATVVVHPSTRTYIVVRGHI
jgi:hypothetical protein